METHRSRIPSILPDPLPQHYARFMRRPPSPGPYPTPDPSPQLGISTRRARTPDPHPVQGRYTYPTSDAYPASGPSVDARRGFESVQEHVPHGVSVRPFKCDQCPRSFNRNHDLKRHKRIHLAVKPFPCGHCDKSFSRKDALKRHKLVKGCGSASATQASVIVKRRPSIDDTDSGYWGSSSSGANSWSLAEGPIGGHGGYSRVASSASVMTWNPSDSQPITSFGFANSPYPSFGSRPQAHPEASPDVPTKKIEDPRLNYDLDSTQSPESLVLSPRSESSSEGSEKCIAARKADVLDRVVQAVTALLRSRFALAHRQVVFAGSSCGLPEQRSSRPGNASYSSQPTAPAIEAKGAVIGPKRKLPDREDDEDNDDQGSGRSKSKTRKGKEIEALKFACPFFKYNQAKYKSWRGCPGPGWPDVHRVKEHLYRRHRQPKYRCGRCWQPFHDEQSHLEHQRTNEPCPLMPVEPVEGFDAAQEVRLKSRKKGATEPTEIDKWNTVFRILFPHIESPPLPYYEYDTQHTDENSLTECEQYILREVPPRLRRMLGPKLDRDLSIVEEGLKREAIDCVKDLLIEAFREFRSISKQDSHALASSAEAQPPVIAEASGSNHRPSPPPEAEEEQTTAQKVTDGETGNDMQLTEFDFDSIFGGLNPDFMSIPEDFLGGAPIIEHLLQPPVNSSIAGEKREGDSGYFSSESSPGYNLRRDFSEP